MTRFRCLMEQLRAVRGTALYPPSPFLDAAPGSFGVSELRTMFPNISSVRLLPQKSLHGFYIQATSSIIEKAGNTHFD